MARGERAGVVLMTYGSPSTDADVPTYVKNVRGGREPDAQLVEEFRRRYTAIGGSPLIRITQAQAAALEKELNRSDLGAEFSVAAGMRYSAPFVAEAVREVARGASTLVGVIMSPQYSPIIMEGYVETISRAADRLGRDDLLLTVARDWHLQPDFIRAVGEKLAACLAPLDASLRERTHVLMTAHSMPKRVVEKEPDYLVQLRETAEAVAGSAGLSEGDWSFCYQSAGHTKEEWLKPDFTDIMPSLREGGCRRVVVSPVQFLADHLETLYDIDIAARKQAEEAGMQFERVPAVNDSPLFIRALAGVVTRTLSEAPLPAARRAKAP